MGSLQATPIGRAIATFHMLPIFSTTRISITPPELSNDETIKIARLPSALKATRDTDRRSA